MKHQRRIQTLLATITVSTLLIFSPSIVQAEKNYVKTVTYETSKVQHNPNKRFYNNRKEQHITKRHHPKSRSYIKSRAHRHNTHNHRHNRVITHVYQPSSHHYDPWDNYRFSFGIRNDHFGFTYHD
ncbi:MAG: hypothetical protein ISR69_09040 [Gammaproteobacteria bacterium]|nr:hypothetical protein [Gammaproteobacteria bacterium]